MSRRYIVWLKVPSVFRRKARSPNGTLDAGRKQKKIFLIGSSSFPLFDHPTGSASSHKELSTGNPPSYRTLNRSGVELATFLENSRCVCPVCIWTTRGCMTSFRGLMVLGAYAMYEVPFLPTQQVRMYICNGRDVRMLHPGLLLYPCTPNLTGLFQSHSLCQLQHT